MKWDYGHIYKMLKNIKNTLFKVFILIYSPHSERSGSFKTTKKKKLKKKSVKLRREAGMNVFTYMNIQ